MFDNAFNFGIGVYAVLKNIRNLNVRTTIKVETNLCDFPGMKIANDDKNKNVSLVLIMTAKRGLLFFGYHVRE